VVSPYASGAAIALCSEYPASHGDGFFGTGPVGKRDGTEYGGILDPSEASLVGKRLNGFEHSTGFNLIVVAIKRVDGKYLYNPAPQKLLHADDIIVAIGRRESG